MKTYDVVYDWSAGGNAIRQYRHFMTINPGFKIHIVEEPSGVGVVPPMEGVKRAPSPVVKSPSRETVIASCTSPKVPTPTEREMTPELRRSARLSKPPIRLDL